MSCASTRFIINKGMTNEFILTIKQQGSIEAMVIGSNDTFEAKLFNLETNKEVLNAITVTVESALEGKIKLSFGDVSSLISERGEKEDRYYLKPTYRIALDCNTESNGSFVAKIQYVYVE